MTITTTYSSDGETLTVHVPMNFRRRGGKKLVVVPNDAQPRPAQSKPGSPLVKLIVRAFYWKRLFDSGDYATLGELAAAEKVDKSHLCKVIRLTLLSPDIIEAILDGTEPTGLEIERMLKPFPIVWGQQLAWLEITI